MNSKQIIVGLILVALLGMVASNTFSIYESGFTVTSIDTDVNYITPSTDLNNVNFLITTVFDSGGQLITGYLTADEIKKESGYETEYPLSIKASAVNEIVDYPIVNDPNYKLLKYSLIPTEMSLTNTNPTCPVVEGKTQPVTIDVWRTFVGTRYCIYEEDVGNIGYLNTPTTSFNSKITLIARGKAYTEEINSFDATSVSFRDENNDLLATARWTGSLVTGNEPPSESLYVTTYRTDLGDTNARWRVTEKSKLTAYSNSRTIGESLLGSVLNTNACASGDLVGCQTNIENILNGINIQLNTLSTGAEVGIGDSKTYLDGNSISGSTLRTTFDRRFANPEVIFSVKAAWLGIKFGVGEPEIISINCPTFSSGDNIGVCDVTFKNVGTADGTFRASFIPSTTSTFRQQYVVTPVTLKPNEQVNVQVYLSHGTSVEETATGTFKVVDVADSSKFDTATTSITMTVPKSCTPYAEEIRGQSIYKCNPQGTGWDFVKTCPAGTVPALNDLGTNLDCKELAITIPSNGGEGNIFDDFFDWLFGDGGTSAINTILIIALIIIIGIIGLVMVYGIVKAVIIAKLT